MTNAVLSVAFLLRSGHVPIELDARGMAERRAETTGSFFLYNNARLVTLFAKYHKCVAKGFYPPLPNLSDINFALLKDDAEWDLCWQFLCDGKSCIDVSTRNHRDLPRHIAPTTATTATSMRISIEGQQPSMPQEYMTVATADWEASRRTTAFIKDMVQTFSSYYSRVPTLTDPDPVQDLLVHARLALLVTVHGLLRQALARIGLKTIPFAI